jgi:hypothetical protein
MTDDQSLNGSNFPEQESTEAMTLSSGGSIGRPNRVKATTAFAEALFRAGR